MMMMEGDVTLMMTMLQIAALLGLHPAAGRWRLPNSGEMKRTTDVMGDVMRVMIMLKIAALLGLHPATGSGRLPHGGEMVRMTDVMEETIIDAARRLHGARAGGTAPTASNVAERIKTNMISGRLLADQTASD